VRGTISRFSLSDDRFQPGDGVKWLTLSTRQFELPPDRPVTFAVDLAVQNISGDPVDYRRGIAVFQVADLEVTRRVFSVCGTSTRVLALHEHLAFGGGGNGVRDPTAPDPRLRSFRIRELHPVADPDGRSRSLTGQGMSARWRRFRVRGANA
jgi:hypothetical protein